MHIGLETVALGGAGFTVHVSPTARPVGRGPAPDQLIDIDLLARRSKRPADPHSLVTNGEAFAIAIGCRTGPWPSARR